MYKRLLAYLVAMSMAVAPASVYAQSEDVPPVEIEAIENRASLQASGEYRYWKQYDSQWGGMYLAPSYDTMSASGCIVTSIAILMVHSMSTDESNMNPGILCQALSNAGGFTSDGLIYWYKVNGILDNFYMAENYVTISGSQAEKVSTIQYYLNQGYYAIAQIGSGWHWVAVDCADGSGDINIMDPGYSKSKLFRDYGAENVYRLVLFGGAGGGQTASGSGIGSGSDITEYYADGTVDAGGSSLNVRGGVGTGNSVIYQLTDGSEVSIVGKGTDNSGDVWYKITIGGGTGFVHSDYVKIGTSSGGDTGMTASGKVSGSYVNVRSGAGTGNGVVTVAAGGESVQILAKSYDNSGNLWYKITINGTTGYMISDYITISSDNGGGNNGGGQTMNSSGYVNASGVNVRSGAGTNNSVVNVLGANAAVTVTGQETAADGSTWYKITFSGGSGYMHSDYVTIGSGGGSSGGGNTSGGSTPASFPASVNGDYVNVRTGPGTGNRAITSLPYGTQISVISKTTLSTGVVWYKINYGGGTGYMISDYVTLK